jgi:hypothetical protein
MCKDEENIVVPHRWLGLIPGIYLSIYLSIYLFNYLFLLISGEELISALGSKHRATCTDKILSVLSFGLYYCFYLKAKQRSHSAIVITTKRIVEIIITGVTSSIYLSIYLSLTLTSLPYSLSLSHTETLGEMPLDLSVTSLFPGDIANGSIRGAGAVLESSLLCTSGTIIASIPKKNSEFAKKMQITNSRSIPIDLKIRHSENTKKIISLTPNEIKLIPFLPREKYQVR